MYGGHDVSKNEETLRRVEQNDDTLTSLRLGGASDVVYGIDFARLGAGIANNHQLRQLSAIIPLMGLSITDRGFYDGIEHNSSIRELFINCCSVERRNIADEELHGILKAYQENNNLTNLEIYSAGLRRGGADIITTTLRRCTNLKKIIIYDCRLKTQQVIPMLETIRGRDSLEVLSLGLGWYGYSIGTAVWEALSTLLGDHDCNIHTLDISKNDLDKEGVTILVSSLVNNTKLKKLKLFNKNANPLDYNRIVDEDVFSTLLCNTRSINSIYLSNHTLQSVSYRFRPDLLLNLNRGTNKNYVAIKKILRFHPIIDMKPLFVLASEEGERSLKALPYIIDWFERAAYAVTEEGTGCNQIIEQTLGSWDSSIDGDDSDSDEEESYNYKIQERKLSAIYEFALAMPLLFVHTISHIKGEDKKRKRDE